MPLYILVPMILTGLPLVIFLVYWTTRDMAAGKLDSDTAEKRFQRDFPHFITEKVIVSDSGKSAFLISKDDDQPGLVWEMGKNHLTRMLDEKTLRRVEETTEGIDLYVNDFTLKKISFPLSDAKARQLLVNQLATE